MPSDNSFNTVFIVDSIPDGQLNTARRLRDDLRDVARDFEPTPRIEYVRVESFESLTDALGNLSAATLKGLTRPLLHLETHGCESGISLANEEFVSWEDLRELLVPLNIATRLNLMVVLAACHGGAFLEALRFVDRAPFWGLIGPTTELRTIQVQQDFGAFYSTLFRTLSPSEAIAALEARAPKDLYYRTTAEGLFLRGWRLYKSDWCSSSQLDFRARRMYRRAKKEKRSPLPSVGHLRRLLAGGEQESFNRIRDTYFMCDLFPEHLARFAVTYDGAEKYGAR